MLNLSIPIIVLIIGSILFLLALIIHIIKNTNNIKQKIGVIITWPECQNCSLCKHLYFLPDILLDTSNEIQGSNYLCIKQGSCKHKPLHKLKGLITFRDTEI